MNLSNYESFGRYPKYKPADVLKVFWRNEIPQLNKLEYPILPYGLGKSYGDSCQNDNGILIDIRGLNKLIAFDSEQGILKCEAGVTLADILKFVVPHGWFLSVTPGTKHITVAGAVANDVHGKNHHNAGTFGNHVLQFELLRSNGERIICSPSQNSELFSATIGGLGLTGLITWVEFKLKPSPTPFFAVESEKFDSLDGFFDINEESEKNFEYIVSWVDTSSSGHSLGRGLYNRGNHADPTKQELPNLPKDRQIPFPFDAPFINSASVYAFNLLYFNKQINRIERSISHFDPFFYPLDAVNGWNKAYGKKGFLQYQFVVPFGNDKFAIREVLRHVSKAGLSTFLTVLKTFGTIQSPGMLSFPRPGVNLAIDFRFSGEKTLKVLKEVDAIVRENGGAWYPAKDARMSSADFKRSYPRWKEFSQYIDPHFSSSFWRRVMELD